MKVYPGADRLKILAVRLQVVREVPRIVDQTEIFIRIFDSQDAYSRLVRQPSCQKHTTRYPLKTGSVPAYARRDRPVPTGKVEVAMVTASAPY